MRLRSLLIGVAAIALMLGGWRMAKLASHYREEAKYHGFAESLARYTAQLARDYPDENARRAAISRMGRVSLPVDSHVARRTTQEWERLAAYNGAMKRKYERASSHPWLTIEPDPPEPE
jgi:hypothetical protein